MKEQPETCTNLLGRAVAPHGPVPVSTAWFDEFLILTRPMFTEEEPGLICNLHTHFMIALACMGNLNCKHEFKHLNDHIQSS